jgi:uncharacterized protein (DUF433 family)
MRFDAKSGTKALGNDLQKKVEADATIRAIRNWVATRSVGVLPRICVESRLNCRKIYCMRKIIIDPDVCNGLPTIEGTRITAQTVLEFLSAGDSIDELLEEYPSLSKDDILACLAYSARLLGHHVSVEAVA